MLIQPTPFPAAPDAASIARHPSAPPVETDAAARAFQARRTMRAVSDLRGGGAVLVGGDGHETLICAATETVDAGSLADLRDWSTGTPCLLRPLEDATGRTMAIAAVPLDDALLTIASLRRLSDPTQILVPPSVGSPRGKPAPAGAAAAIALAKLGRLSPTVVVGMASADGLVRAGAAGAVVTKAAHIAALLEAGGSVVAVGEARLPLAVSAETRLVAFRNPDSGIEHVAIVIGNPERAEAPLVRLHSECFTGDVLGSLRCDCGPQLQDALRRMADEGCGVVLYLAQEGRGIGLLNKLRSYVLQDRGLDTIEANAALGWGADERDFAVAATMLRGLGLSRVRLLTNNPAKIAALQAGGLVVERTSLLVAPNGVNDAYLATKTHRFGHLAE